VAFILASLLTLDRLFQADFDDGSFDVLVLSPLSLELVVLAKSLAHWLANAVPLIIAAPILALMLNMHMAGLVVLTATLAIGTLGLTLLGAMGAALTVSVRRAGLLTSLLVLPLYIPILIFGVGAVAAAERAMAGGEAIRLLEPNLLLLTATSLFGLVIGLLAAAGGLRLHIE
jgi:heme exporter protein B